MSVSVRQFHAAIRGEGQPAATGEEAALQSASSGKAVKIDPKLGA
ncbi:hypothetical protein [Mesorhizobium cantuariense]|uniref:Uncharacterized protein n=1 Tax=Mesorhizobium cantuariense TaxID=1300275 RepID=A0ABV7MVN8_9HYPH